MLPNRVATRAIRSRSILWPLERNGNTCGYNRSRTPGTSINDTLSISSSRKRCFNTSKRAQAERAQAERAQAERAQAERAHSERAQAERAQADRAQTDRAQTDRAQAKRQDLLDGLTFESKATNLTSDSCLAFNDETLYFDSIEALQEHITKVKNYLASYSQKSMFMDKSTTQISDINKIISALANHVKDPKMSSEDVMACATEADSILRQLEERADNLGFLRPSAVTYNCIIHLWAAAATHNNVAADAAMYAKGTLDRMISRWQLNSQNPTPTSMTFNSVLNAIAKLNHHYNLEEAGIEAEKLVLKMDTWAHGNKDRFFCRQNSHTFASLIEVHAASGNAFRAQAILDELTSRSLNDVNFPKPDRAIYHSVLRAWARSHAGIFATNKAESLFRQMSDIGGDLSPNTQTFTLMVDCWSRVGTDEAADKAESYLKTMEVLYEDGHGVKPNAHTFTSAMKCWSIANNPIKADKIHSLLHSMFDLYETYDDIDFLPNTETCNLALHALAKFSVHKNASNNSLEIFNKMKLLADERNLDSIRPNKRSYNEVMHALSKQKGKNATQLIENLLEEMSQLSLINPDFVPDKFGYNCLIDAYAKSNRSDRGEKSRAVLDKMLERYNELKYDKDMAAAIQPDSFSFTRVIAACAGVKGTTSRKRKALTIALKTFEDVKNTDYVAINYFAYSVVLNAVCCLSENEKERERMIEHIFHLCKSAGELNHVFLRTLLQHSSRKSLAKLLGPIAVKIGKSEIKLSDLDPSWSVNIPSSEKM